MEKQDLYPDLCGEIRKKFRTQGAFARAIGINPSTLSSKLSGRTQWSYSDVENICRVLEISMVDAPIFFNPNVATLQRCVANSDKPQAHTFIKKE